MVDKRTSRRFAADNRAVSAVIGFILIFGILVLLLTVYQAQIVPQQNAQTEFEHFEDNKNEMIELRNAISDSGQNDFSRFASVKLGTNYQTRLLTINPAPPSGTLQTVDAPDIKIWNKSDTDAGPQNVSTKFLQYRSGYNELNTGPIWYEHSVLYLDESDRGNDVSIIEDQNLVVDNQNLSVTALQVGSQNEFQETGTGRITLELYTNDNVEEPLNISDNFKIQIPTRLDESYWNKTEIPQEMWVDDTAVNDSLYPDEESVNGLKLESSDSVNGLELNTVGVRSEPKESDSAVRNTDPRGDSTDRRDETDGEFIQLDVSLRTYTTGASNSGSVRPEGITIDDFETSSDDEVTFTATEDDGSGTSGSQTASDPSEIGDIDIPQEGNNDFDVVVTAEIDSGECLETSFNDEDNEGSVKSLNDDDWNTCNT